MIDEACEYIILLKTQPEKTLLDILTKIPSINSVEWVVSVLWIILYYEFKNGKSPITAQIRGQLMDKYSSFPKLPFEESKRIFKYIKFKHESK